MKKEIPGIGRVVFRKYKRSRNVNIHVSPFRDIKVTLPVWISYRDAEHIIVSRKDWIIEQSEKMREWREKNCSVQDTPFEEDGGKFDKWLIKRTEELALKHGFNVGRISVRGQRTRWGSCSGTDNISLNRKLAGVPDELVDYVILHELVHTRVKDHSRDFWDQLDLFVEDARGLDRRLKEFSLDLL